MTPRTIVLLAFSDYAKGQQARKELETGQLMLEKLKTWYLNWTVCIWMDIIDLNNLQSARTYLPPSTKISFVVGKDENGKVTVFNAEDLTDIIAFMNN